MGKSKVRETVKKHSLNYLTARKKLGNQKHFTLEEAVSLLKNFPHPKFDSSIELAINVVDTKVHGEVSLPHGTGKEVRVALFNEQISDELTKGQINFDILIATPAQMKDLLKFAKLLGPKGLMPTPKKGTLVSDLSAAKAKFQSGAVNFKTEAKAPIIHQTVGRLSFSEKKLEENVLAFLKAIGIKNLGSVFIKSTMSPSLKLNIESIKL